MRRALSSTDPHGPLKSINFAFRFLAEHSRFQSVVSQEPDSRHSSFERAVRVGGCERDKRDEQSPTVIETRVCTKTKIV